MNYELHIFSLTDSELIPIPPQPDFRSEVGQIVRLKHPYNQARFCGVTGVSYPDLSYRVTYILDDYRNNPTVQVESIEEVETIVSNPFPQTFRYHPTCEIITGYLELVES